MNILRRSIQSAVLAGIPLVTVPLAAIPLSDTTVRLAFSEKSLTSRPR